MNRKLSARMFIFKMGGGETKCTESPESFTLRKQLVACPHLDWLVKFGQVIKPLNTTDHSAIKTKLRVYSYLRCRDEVVNLQKHAVHIMYDMYLYCF